MQKIACVFSYQMSSWVSCQKIVFNLHKSYQTLPDVELLNFNYSSDQTLPDHNRLAQSIFNAGPQVIAVLDHKPHPLALFQLLLPMYRNVAQKPRIVFHIFGDFTLFYTNWEKMSVLLAGFQVDFIVASDRQKILIDKFLNAPMAAEVCPFPVDPIEFNYTPSLRGAQRALWGVNEKDTVLIFTGRLSRQKRIITLISTFAEAMEKTGSENTYLFLYGNPDDIGDPMLGKWESEGEYFRKIDRLYQGLPGKIKDRIRFMGSVPNAELKSVYQGADLLMNLSVHNDEDYGMSVAEAQCSGLPAVLTDWGGLASFFHPEYPEATQYIPVKIGLRSKVVSRRKVVDALIDVMQRGPHADREKISKQGLGKLGVEAAGTILRKLLASEARVFNGYTSFFDRASTETFISPAPYVTPHNTINDLYRKLYSAYVRNT